MKNEIKMHQLTVYPLKDGGTVIHIHPTTEGSGKTVILKRSISPKTEEAIRKHNNDHQEWKIGDDHSPLP